MASSKFSASSLIAFSLFVGLTGASALFRGGHPDPAKPAIAEPAYEQVLAGGQGAGGGAPAPSPAPRAGIRAPEEPASATPSAPEPAAVQPPASTRRERETVARETVAAEPVASAAAPGQAAVETAEAGGQNQRPAAMLAAVHPPQDPRPSAYRIPPSLVEKPVQNPSRAERPVPLRAMLTAAERELLAHLIYAEAAGEPFEGKVAVAAVILNRLDNPQFPNTIEGVIFEPYAFEPVRNGRLWRGTSARSYQALDEALRGRDPTNGALYFYNPRLVSPDNWIWSRKVVRVIGRHHFGI